MKPETEIKLIHTLQLIAITLMFAVQLTDHASAMVRIVSLIFGVLVYFGGKEIVAHLRRKMKP